ncbi:sorbitol dehydrogenase, putative [Phytophthora infestans T30-4]|uniref:Sorbitol dehydrogenase, putative n=1 Tax=Phytophthora infestans (strain T30-4) TaxID=403677 RepID=D0NAP3_PHYIT|nr:sorbitol dehydrogenase, putative [Phytophthora infestans T30-4]EEY54901.1 sorbitol dehydrogenase, putative [Phytophthora infestans T30-4]|eukprot:XP_002903846.1 sorbitol dehydrogenase, putative [Phytophthora infestans T30-4]
MTQVVKVYGQGDVRFEAYERPPTGPRDVVVKLKVAGICGSDLMYIRIGGIPPGHVTAIGHEAAGIVTEVGNEVEGITVGMRVVVNPMKTPSNIGSGGPEGAFTQELLVRDAKLGASVLPIPDDIPYEIAALCDPLAVAMHGVNRADVKAGDKVVVFGCGPIDLGMLMWLVDRGVTDVVALDLAEERLERARALGIRAALDPTKVSLREELTKLHGEVPSYNRLGVGTDAFIDAAGAPNILSDVVMMAKYHSRLVITAAHMKPLQFPVGRMLTSEMTITTAVGYPTEMPEVMAAMPRLQSKIASLISHRLAFQNILDGLKVAGTPSSAKVIVEFD